MAGAAPSNESTSRRTLRLAFGVTLTFLISQLVNWPLAFPAPVFVAILLLDTEPLSVRQGLSVIATAFAAMLGGFLVTFFLLPFPAVMVLTLCLALYRVFIFILGAGAHLLAIVGIVLGFTVIPVVAALLPEIALIAGLGLFADIVIAIPIAWLAFILIPAPPAPPALGHDEIPQEVIVSSAGTLTLVVAPLLAAFLVFGWTKVLVLIYSAIFATALGSVAAGKKGWKSMHANLIYGGVGMLLIYELMVMVPSIPFMIVLIFAVCMLFASRIFGGGPTAALWTSGFFGFLILLGSALPAEGVSTSIKTLDRVWQILLATAYLVFAFRVVDLFKDLFTRRSVLAGR